MNLDDLMDLVLSVAWHLIVRQTKKAATHSSRYQNRETVTPSVVTVCL